MLGLTDLILIGTRWIHALAGATWVGGGLFYLLVLQPSLAASENGSPIASLKASVAKEFKEIVELAMMGLAITGALLAFDRLSQGNVSNLYVVILLVKVAAAGGMFLFARTLGPEKRRPGRSRETPESSAIVDPPPSFLRGRISPPQIIVILGVVVFFLASMLQLVFEKRI